MLGDLTEGSAVTTGVEQHRPDRVPLLARQDGRPVPGIQGTATFGESCGSPPDQHLAEVLDERPRWSRRVGGSSDVGLGPRASAAPSRTFADVLRKDKNGR